MYKHISPRRIAAGLGAAALSLGMLSACGEDSGNGAGNGDGDGVISIGYLDWDEAVAVTYLWAHMLTDEGYEVELSQLEVGPIFEDMSGGNLDLFMDVWLPVTHEEYWDEYGDSLESLGVWYDNASLSIAVPAYVDEVDSLEELADNADLFGGRIVGIDSGAGLTRITEEEVIPTYGLDGTMDLTTSNTPSMLAELDSAIANEEPVVVTLWHPHWAYSKYDLKDLDDPEGTLGEVEEVSIVARDGFSGDQPEVAEMLEDFVMDDQQLAELEEQIFDVHDGDAEAGVEAWLEENPDFPDSVM